jgi:hypothetical protein
VCLGSHESCVLHTFFQVFVVMYALSILALVIQSYRVAMASRNATLVKLVKLSASVYIGGFLFLWIPEHLLCVLPTTGTCCVCCQLQVALPRSLHPTHYTPHTTPHSLHPTHYTLLQIARDLR